MATSPICALEDIADAAWQGPKDYAPGKLDDLHEALFKTGVLAAFQIVVEAGNLRPAGRSPVTAALQESRTLISKPS